MGPEMTGPTDRPVSILKSSHDGRAGVREDTHKRAKVTGEVKGVPKPTLVQEHDICNDGRLGSL